MLGQSLEFRESVISNAMPPARSAEAGAHQISRKLEAPCRIQACGVKFHRSCEPTAPSLLQKGSMRKRGWKRDAVCAQAGSTCHKAQSKTRD